MGRFRRRRGLTAIVEVSSVERVGRKVKGEPQDLEGLEGVVLIARPSARGVSLALAMILTVTIAVVSQERSASATPELPAFGALFGALVDPRGNENPIEAIRRVEGQIGREFDIHHRFYKWDEAIPTWIQRRDVEAGRLPFINWSAGSTNGDVATWASIAGGAHDGWIAERADAFAAFGSPIYVTFHHEPEIDEGRFGSADEYAAAFRHIVDVFRSRGAANVGWVFDLTARSFRPGTGPLAERFWPGDGYVDLVAADGYNWAPGDPSTQWTSFRDVFEGANSWATGRGIPWMVAEYGVQEDPAQPGRKAAWLLEALETIKSWPLLKAVVYFDKNKLYNWLTDTSASAMDAYRTMAQDPYLNQSPALPPPPLPTFLNGLNIGPDGAAVSTGVPPAGRPFDGVTTTGDARLIYDDDRRPLGRFAAKHILTPGDDAYYQWSGARQVWYGRIYVRLKKGLPPGDLRLVRGRSGSELRCSISIDPSGRLVFADRDNNAIMRSSASVVPGHWVRLEWLIDHSQSLATLQLFRKPNSDQATEVITATDVDVGFSADQFQFGRSGSQPFSITFWTDGPAVSSDGFLGPIRR